MARIGRWMVMAGLLAGAALLASCQTKSHSSEEPVLGLEAQDRTPFLDVPLPLGFHESYDPLSFTTYATYRLPRAAHMHYTGGSDFLSVVKFYLDYLPPEGWTLKANDHGGGVYYLRFMKPNETLRVDIYAQKGQTELTIRVEPGDATVPGHPKLENTDIP